VRARLTGGASVAQRADRVKALLPRAGLPPAVSLSELATERGLDRGRAVILRKCVQCHDLRTVLARPRTPDSWVETIRRMAAHSVLQPISGPEQAYAVAYLVAISPDLQESVQLKRRQELAKVPAEVFRSPPATAKQEGAPAEPFEMATAKAAFESTCNG
jgi:mono/diheme cytochrome c family protein